MKRSQLEKMALDTKSALITINGIDAGTLEMIATDEYRFTYFSEYCKAKHTPISLALPLREEPYLSQTLHPFFDNLIFEGDQLRLAERRYGLNRLSQADRFKLLMITGQALIGPVRVLPYINDKPNDLAIEAQGGLLAKTKNIPLKPAYVGHCPVCLKPTLGKEHSSCLKSLWGNKSNVRIEAYEDDPANIFKTIITGQSISGAQRKALFCLKRNGTLSRLGHPTHILKPEGEFKEMPANEHLTMAIARQLKFTTPPVGLYEAEGIGLIFVAKRFDLLKNQQTQFVEDMAQISQELAIDKDQATIEAVSNLIKKHTTSPKIELAEFFRRLLFCFITGNGDMHLKNWSLYTEAKSGYIKLSPLYDYLNVRTSFPQEQVEMILSVNDKRDKIIKQDFTSLALNELNLDKNYVEKLFNQLPNWIETISEFCSRSALSSNRADRYMEVVNERFRRLK